MRSAADVRLVPVLETYTGVLDGQPGGPLTDPKWDAVYRDRVVAAGLPAPVDAHPWYVAVPDLHTGPGLHRLVQALLTAQGDLRERLAAETTAEEALEEVPALPGGYLLSSGDRCLALPGCCGDLGDLDEWQQAAAHAAPAPATLWVGHPWLLVTADGDDLTLMGPVDKADVTVAPRIAVVERERLTRAVTMASGAVERFADTVRTVCARFTTPDNVPGMADALLGAHGTG